MQHVWVASPLGHGNLMCKNCKMTNREAIALGMFDVCEKSEENTIQKIEDISSKELMFLGNLLMGMNPNVEICVSYTNYQGETRFRKIVPSKVFYGSTHWHKEPCLLLLALDLETNEQRLFKVADFGEFKYILK